jgi:hypothetical protein
VHVPTSVRRVAGLELRRRLQDAIVSVYDAHDAARKLIDDACSASGRDLKAMLLSTRQLASTIVLPGAAPPPRVEDAAAASGEPAEDEDDTVEENDDDGTLASFVLSSFCNSRASLWKLLDAATSGGLAGQTGAKELLKWIVYWRWIDISGDRHLPNELVTGDVPLQVALVLREMMLPETSAAL